MNSPSRGPVVAWVLAALAAVAVALALRESFLGMAFQWRSSSTFSYGVLILPISLFLLWRERARLAAVPAEPSWLALFLMIPVGVSWVLAMLLDVNVVHHFAAVVLVALAVWAVLGTPASRVIWFPLAYLLLMVPFGEFLVPTLMQWTADFAVVAVGLSGVPVFQDGFVFSLPSGDFEVIKACSGIRFLMATVAAGTVFAWVAYRSWQKRLVFLMACLVVPVVGNVVRAYLVVMLVHLSDGRLAGAHVLYGTIFFGAILLAMFVIGARYADPPAPSAVSPERVTSRGATATLPVAAMAAIVAVVTAAVPGELRGRAAGAEAGAPPAMPGSLAGYGPPESGVHGWLPVLRGADGETIARYQSVESATPVDVFVAVYDHASGGGEVTDSRNQLFDRKTWRRVGGGPGAGYAEAVLRPAPQSAIPEGTARIVWSWYVVNGRAADSRVDAKLLELRGLLGGEPFQQGIVALSATFDTDSDGARRDLRAFAPAFCARAGLPCPPALGRVD
ncbi:MAG: exosortase A [Gammaproteobacteria bacterium]